jgi:hypothetical protein
VLTIILASALSGLLAFLGASLRYRPARADTPAATPCVTRWKAEVHTAQQYRADYYGGYFGEERKCEPLRGEVAVRLSNGTKNFLTVGTVQTDDEQFDELLHTMVAQAEDRASTLNAVQEMVAA